VQQPGLAQQRLHALHGLMVALPRDAESEQVHDELGRDLVELAMPLDELRHDPVPARSWADARLLENQPQLLAEPPRELAGPSSHGGPVRDPCARPLDVPPRVGARETTG